jgi:hypothetical protein
MLSLTLFLFYAKVYIVNNKKTNMTNPNIPQVLDPGRFIPSIRRNDEFISSLPRASFESMAESEKRESIRRAVAAGAISIAEGLEKKHGGYDLDANLYKLVAGLNDFHEASVIMDELRDEYDSAYYMPPKEKRIFYDHKDKITEFNHVLKEVINVGASRFDFEALLTFMTNMYVAGSRPEHEEAESFHSQARFAIIGMRNEVAVEQLLIAGDIDHEPGTKRQDDEGGDIVVQTVFIDLKASEKSAEKAKRRARMAGRNPDLVVWSHIYLEDFEGQLALPYRKNEEILGRLLPDLKKALASEGEQLAA